jgi:hypothetical protein
MVSLDTERVCLKQVFQLNCNKNIINRESRINSGLFLFTELKNLF